MNVELIKTGEPSTAWKRQILLADHSPVRKLTFNGFCPEFRSCGYCNTPSFRKALDNYRG